MKEHRRGAKDAEESRTATASAQHALEHQKGPYATVWFALGKPYEKYSDNSDPGKVMSAEAFASSTFLKYADGHYAGNSESHAWWNAFVLWPTLFKVVALHNEGAVP